MNATDVMPQHGERARKADVHRTIFQSEHEIFRDSFNTFLPRQALPHWERWEFAGLIDRSYYEAVGRGGFLGMADPDGLGDGGMEEIIGRSLAKGGS